MPATVSDVRCRRLRCRSLGSNWYIFLHRSFNHLYTALCPRLKLCAWRLAVFLHYYSGAVALYITQNRVGAADSFTFWHLRFTLVTAAWVFETNRGVAPRTTCWVGHVEQFCSHYLSSRRGYDLMFRSVRLCLR